MTPNPPTPPPNRLEICAVLSGIIAFAAVSALIVCVTFLPGATP